MRKHHTKDSSGWGNRFRKSSVRGSIPKDSSVRGSSPGQEVTFSIDVKGGEIHQMQVRELDAWRESTEACFQGERWSQGEHKRYDFSSCIRVFPSMPKGEIVD
jgi:hypothetical protein